MAKQCACAQVECDLKRYLRNLRATSNRWLLGTVLEIKLENPHKPWHQQHSIRVCVCACHCLLLALCDCRNDRTRSNRLSKKGARAATKGSNKVLHCQGPRLAVGSLFG